MAIQNRRGIFSDLDPTKLLPGEYAVVISGDPDNTDGNGVYICFAPGQVKKIALTEDYTQLSNDVDDLKDEFDDLGLSVVDGKINITYEGVSA